MTVEIPLTRGYVALIDDEDFDLVGRVKWTVHISGHSQYAYRSAGGRQTMMHRVLTGWDRTDHINGNGLDNRRVNLRRATHVQNLRNSRSRAGSSIYKGVYWQARQRRPWCVQIGIRPRKKLYVGVFADEVEAALAYDAAAREHFGEFAAVNFPLPGERGALGREPVTARAAAR